jgi:hypothetical protein
MSEVGGIIVTFDLRARWQTVRDQAARPSCLACATADAHSRVHGLNEHLSAEFLFWNASSRMGDARMGLTFEAVQKALADDGQPCEHEWPYQQFTPTPWEAPPTNDHWFGLMSEPLPTRDSIVAAVRAGSTVILGLRMVAGFQRVQAAPYVIETSGPAAGGHAVLAVGLGSRSAESEDLLLIRNSWGPRWACEGHAWLPLPYLSDKLIDARRVMVSSPIRARRNR